MVSLNKERSNSHEGDFPIIETVPRKELPPEYHIAIGVITVNGAIMDQLVDSAIWMILQMPPERGLPVTKLLVSTARKIDFLKDLLEPLFEDNALKNKFQNVYMKLKSAQANRSKIVHAKWVFSASDQSILIELPPEEDLAVASTTVVIY